MNEPTLKRSCVSCAFMSVEFPNPTVAQSAMVCRHSPPLLVVVKDRAGNAVPLTMQPQVSAEHWCHQWKANAVANNGTLGIDSPAHFQKTAK